MHERAARPPRRAGIPAGLESRLENEEVWGNKEPTPFRGGRMSEGTKAWRASNLRQPSRDVAEMLWVWRDGSEASIRENSHLSKMWSRIGQVCECGKEHPCIGSGTGPCGGRASTCPAKEDKQVWSMKQEAHRFQPWVVHTWYRNDLKIEAGHTCCCGLYQMSWPSQGLNMCQYVLVRSVFAKCS